MLHSRFIISMLILGIPSNCQYQNGNLPKQDSVRAGSNGQLSSDLSTLLRSNSTLSSDNKEVLSLQVSLFESQTQQPSSSVVNNNQVHALVNRLPHVDNSALNSEPTTQQNNANNDQSVAPAVYVIPERVAVDISKRNNVRPVNAAEDLSAETQPDPTNKEGASLQTSKDVDSVLKDTFLFNNPTLPFLGALEDEEHMPFTGWQPRLNLPSWLTGSPSKRSREEAPDTPPGNAHQDGSAMQVEQRSGQRCMFPDVLMGEDDLPWTCQQRFVWRYLGEHVYPSRVYEAQCESRTCWYGHFNCSAITYTLHVLQACRRCQDQRVPYVLRSRWQWTDLNITVGCQCIR
jgi:hypothetical protein